PFMTDTVHQEINALLWRPFAQMVSKRKDYPGAPMHSPEQHPDLILRCLREPQIIQHQFPIQGPTLGPKWGPENISSVDLMSPIHILLEVMSRNNFVMQHGTGKMRIVAPH